MSNGWDDRDDRDPQMDPGMYDPWIDEEAPPLEEAAVFFIGTNHDKFLEYIFPENSVVIDPWRFIKDSSNIKLVHVGNSNG